MLVGGAGYVESGFTSFKGQTDITTSVITTGTVDASKTGVYTITYTVTDSEGYTVFVRRYIGVITAAAAAMDISGTYKRNGGALGSAVVEKLNYPGLYTNNNPGGATTDGTAAGKSITDIILYMFQTEATVVSCPSQESSVGEFACTGGIYDATGAKPLFKWVCVNSGYGTSVRTFIKQ